MRTLLPHTVALCSSHPTAHASARLKDPLPRGLRYEVDSHVAGRPYQVDVGGDAVAHEAHRSAAGERKNLLRVGGEGAGHEQRGAEDGGRLHHLQASWGGAVSKHMSCRAMVGRGQC